MTPSEKMGEVYADIVFHGARGSRQTLRLLVDTGSSYTWIPRSLARRLGVLSTDRIGLEIADGRTVWRDLGEIEAEILGARATTLVIFGAPKDMSVVGLYTLEGLRLWIDPVTRRLRRGRRALAVSPRLLGPPRAGLALA